MISRAYIPFILNSEILQVERARPGTPMIRKPYSTSTEGNTGLKEQRRRRLRKRPLKVNSRNVKLHLAYSISFHSLRMAKKENQ